MRTKNILLGMAAALFALALTGCYEKFDTPGPAVRYNDDYFTGSYQEVSIKDIKNLFSDGRHTITNIKDVTLPNNSLAPTAQSTFGKYCMIEEPYFIKGRVISNDAYGNFFRSVFIMDEEGEAIEIKIGPSGLYTKYPVGETIYVVCEGLALGNYRSTLSLGLKPMAEDESDSGEPYANKYMEVPLIIDHHVKLGPATELAVGDTVVVKAGDGITDAQFMALSGKLVRIEGLKSVWNADYPSFLFKYEFNKYENYHFQTVMDTWKQYREGGSVGEPPKGIQRTEYTMPEPLNNYIDYSQIPYRIYKEVQENAQPSWGFQEIGGLDQQNYGSALFTLDGYSGSNEILIRTSGFSRFAMDPVTPHGKTVNVTGIIARYTDKDDRYTPAYQITVNNVRDIKQVD